jgi:hypothetical protein
MNVLLRLVTILFLLISLTVTQSAAQAPIVNPVSMSWTAPTKNEDNVTPLTDLAGYHIRVRATAGGAVLKQIDHPSTTLAPTANTKVTHGSLTAPFYKELGLPDGTYLATVSAYDTSGNEKGEGAASGPLVLNQLAPAIPTDVQLNQ